MQVQYWHWLDRVLHGDLGSSLFSGEPVTSSLNGRLPVSLSLIIVGTHDPSTPPARGEELVSAIPNASMAALAAAHMSCVEDPAGFAALVRDFSRTCA